MKGSKLRRCPQNEGLSGDRRRASGMQPGPRPAGGKEPGGQQPEPEGRGKLGPRDRVIHQTASRLPVASQVSVGSWAVDIHQEGGSQRSAPQRRRTARLGGRSCCGPGIWAAGTGEVMSRTAHLGRLPSPSTWSPELLGPGKGTKRRPNWACASVEDPRTWTRAAQSWEVHATRGRFRRRPRRATGQSHTPERGKPGEAQALRAPPHPPGATVCRVPPSPQHQLTFEPK